LDRVGSLFARVVRLVTDRPLATIGVVCALAIGGLVLALQLQASDSTGALVGGSSEAEKATDAFHRQFGDEAVRVLVAGDLERTLLVQENMGKLIALEGCIAARVPPDGRAAFARLPSPCQEIERLDAVQSVYGPGTFVNTSAEEIGKGFQDQQAAAKQRGKAAADAAYKLAIKRGYSKRRARQLADEAMRLSEAQFQRDILQLAVRYGISSVPSAFNTEFVSQLVFDPARGVNQPKARFAYLFPSSRAAVMHIRLRPDLSSEDRGRALDLIRAAASDPFFKMGDGQRYVVTGVPAFAQGAASAAQKSIFVLLAAAIAVMAATLMLVFRTRPRVRLLPLALALGAAAMTYGALALAGHELTIASIAALPVLIGLAVDYAIQLHARFDESRREPLAPREAARAAARRGAPTIAGAALATAGGFVVLLLSPVSAVHGFAIVVIVGIALALACAVTAGLAALTRFSHPRERPADLPPLLPRLRATARRAGASLARRRAGRALEQPRVSAAVVAGCVVLAIVAAAVHVWWLWLVTGVVVGAAAALFALLPRARAGLGDSVGRRARATLDYAVARPRKVLGIALALAVLGFVADPLIKVASDPRDLVPQDLAALRDLNELERATGVSGDIYVTVNADDVSSPDVVGWMGAFQRGVLGAHGYQAGETCLQEDAPELCPGPAITDFIGGQPGQEQNARAVLEALPPYFSSALVSPDRRTANLSFGIRLMPLDRQKEVIDDIRARLDPPDGVTAAVVGVPVLAADANAELASEWRRLLMLVAGLAAVFLVLLALRRRPSYAAVPLIPIALATGWSSLILFASRVPLNAMSATLAALTIAISTEFSVLLSARYRAERDAGASAREALRKTYASTGAAVLASGATAIAGFAAMIASDWPMLQGFGLVTVINLTVSLLGVMIVLPAALVWAEQHGPFTLADLDPRPPARAGWRAVRGAGSALGRLRPPLPRRSRA
jgi:hydrophobe/amphiphile efflux-3 (HAE3) family protein